MAGKIRVRFKGIADVRTITPKDLEGAGVDVNALGIDKDLVWSRVNLFEQELPANDKLEEILRGEGHFTISKVEDAGTDSLVANAENPDTEGDLIVDGNTGASTVPAEVYPTDTPEPTEGPSEATPVPRAAKTTSKSTRA